MAYPLTRLQAPPDPITASDTAPPGPSFKAAPHWSAPLGDTFKREFERAGLSWLGSGKGLDADRRARFDAPIHHSFVGLDGGMDWPTSFALTDGTTLLLDRSLFEQLDDRRAARIVLPALQPPPQAVVKHDPLDGADAARHINVEWHTGSTHWYVSFGIERRGDAWHATSATIDDGRRKTVELPLRLALPTLGLAARVPSDVFAADPALRDALLGPGSKRHASASADGTTVSFATLVPCAGGGAEERLVVVSLRPSPGGEWEVAAARFEPVDLPRSLQPGCVQALEDAGMPGLVVDFVQSQLQAPQAGAQLRWSSKVAQEPVFEFEGAMPLYSTDQGTVHSGPYYIRLEFGSRADGHAVRSARFGPHRDDHEYKRLRGGVPGPRDTGQGSASTLSTASEAVSMPPGASEQDDAVVTTASSAPGADPPAPRRPNEPWIIHPQLTEDVTRSRARREALPGAPANRLPQIRNALQGLGDQLSRRQGQPRPNIAPGVWAYASPNEPTWYVQFANDQSNIVLDVRQEAAGTGLPVGRFDTAPEALIPGHNDLYRMAKARGTMDSLGAPPPVIPGVAGDPGYSSAQVKANVALVKAAIRACKQAADAIPGLPPATPNVAESVPANGGNYRVKWADANRTVCLDIRGPHIRW